METTKHGGKREGEDDRAFFFLLMSRAHGRFQSADAHHRRAWTPDASTCLECSASYCSQHCQFQAELLLR